VPSLAVDTSAVGQHAAFQVSPHLFLDVEWQVVFRSAGLLEKGLEMFGQDMIERLLLRLATAVGGKWDVCGCRHGACW
jgi:hypothetical protein